MEWRGRRQSSNVEDRRGQPGGGGLGGSGGGLGGPGGGPRLRFPMGGGRGGIGGIGGIVVLLVIAWLTGTNPLQLIGLDMGGGSESLPTTSGRSGAPADDAGKFIATVLADTEDAWTRAFRAAGKTYAPPTLVLFTGSTRSACGAASAAIGPFYCPADKKVYLDLDFFAQLSGRLGAQGDFAQAYVVAHEVGHHVQNLLGTIRPGTARAEGATGQSVRTELQADCFSGIWARFEQNASYLQNGDIEEAMRAAAAVGDDALQKSSRGYAVPDSFTHGSSAQRKAWFNRGLTTGSIEACDTFSAGNLDRP